MAAASDPQFWATKGFLRDWERVDGVFRQFTRGAVRDLVAIIGSGLDWRREYKSPEGEYRRFGTFRQVPVSGGNRLIVEARGADIVFFALGVHDITEDAQRRLGTAASNRLEPVPPELLRPPSSVFIPPADGALKPVGRWAPEFEPDGRWMLFLSDEQCEVRRSIEDDLEALVEGKGWGGASHLVMGGPGTGKTSILLSVLESAVSFGDDRERPLKIRLNVSDAMREFLRAQTTFDYSAFMFTSRESENTADVLLVDDPPTLSSAKAALVLSREKNPRRRKPLVVVAMDPIQLYDGNQDVTDENIRDMLVEAEAHDAHWLHTCYRQKAEPGAFAYEVSKLRAQSSPFGDEKKKRRHWQERADYVALANEVEFANPSGFAGRYPSASAEDWGAYLDWVREMVEWDDDNGIVDRWAPLLVLVHGFDAFPVSWERPSNDEAHLFIASAHLPDGGVHPRVASDWVQEVKGLEYRHVAVLLPADELNEVTTTTSGDTQAKFEERRRLRIPFSRARDSLAVFGVTGAEDD